LKTTISPTAYLYRQRNIIWENWSYSTSYHIYKNQSDTTKSGYSYTNFNVNWANLS